MKRNKIMFVIAIVAILAVLFVACDEGTQPEHTHTYGAWTVTTAPTEDTAGSATRACACGDVETTTVAKLSDTTVWTVDASQDATHTSKGFKVYKSAYGTVTVTIEKTTGHTYGAWTLTKNPTTTETGTAKRSCVCGYEEETPVAALTDASVWTTATSQDPTHESKGFVQYTSEYGTVLVEVAAGQHTYNNWTLRTAPTLTETGLALKTCVCGHYEEETVAVLTDTTVWAKQHTDATHQAAGSDVYTSVYGTVTIVIPQIEHSFTGEYRVNEDGTHSRKCTGCDAYSTAVEHDFSKKVIDDAHKATDADCTNAATYYYSCECGAVSTELTFENGTALGHNYSEFKVTKEPTCTETGTADSICSVCGDTQHNTLAALGHKYTNQYEQISYEYGDYGEIYQHAPKCDVCGYVNESAAKNHKYDNEHFHVTSGDVVYNVCNVCGYYDDTNPVGSLSDWTVKESVAADYNKAGYTIYTKDTYEYRKEFAKLVAPYDGKTYTAFELKIDDNGAFNKYHWSAAQITFNENGVGTGTAHPFRGTTKITMVDASTGKITRTLGSDTYEGYVDFETGIMVTTAKGLYNDVFMIVPVDSGIKSDDITGSLIGDSIATSYTTLCNLHEYHTFNMLINDDGVLFGVKFQDKDGNTLTSDQCGSANYVKVSAKDGKALGAYQKNADGSFVKTDGKEGTYNDATYGDVVLNGIGGATIGENTGVYFYNTDKACYELYVGTSQADATAYYTFTLTDGAIALTKPMTTITYITTYGADTIGDEYKQANNNVKFTLPVLSGIEEAGDNMFVGWTVEGQEGYVREYTPTGADVTFTAVWRAPLTVTILDGLNGDTSVPVPYGEIIFDRLPKWGDVGNYEFVGWFVDVNSDGKYTEADDEEFDETMTATSNITLIAVWKEIPPYVGTYYGTELWQQGGYGNKGGSTLTIDKQGNISGLKTGKVNSYDAATQTITWTGGKFYFDVDAKIILGIHNNNDIADDYYFFAKDMADSNGKVAAQYGVYAFKEDGSTVIGCYAQFIQAKTALGDNTNVFTYRNKIYSGVEIKDTLGRTLVIDKNQANSIAKSASVVVYKDGKVIFARAAAEGKATIGDSTSSSYMPRELDAYFGTYTCEGQDSLVFGGTGEFAWGEKSGTYTVTDADAKKFGLYVADKDGKNIEYYVVTLNASTYTAEKPTVTINFVVPEGFAPIDDMTDVNANIGVALPDGKVTGYVFNGYYKDQAYTQRVDETNFVTSKSVTLYAKYSTPVTITYHYNDGTTANKEVVYSMGEKQSVADPSKAKYLFAGWYLDDATFANEWDGIADVDKDVYAKWVECAYAQKYTFVYVSSLYTKSGTSNASKPSYAVSVTFDGMTGKGTFDRTDKKETLPFYNCSSTNSYEKQVGWYEDDTETVYLGYAIEVSSYDVATGNITFSVVKYAENSNNDETYTYYGIVDKATGIIVVSYNVDEKTITKFGFFMPEGYSVSATNATTWNGKNTVLDYTDATNATHTLLISDGSVYLDAKVVDIDGNHIACNDVAKAECVLIYASQDAERPLYSLGYDGTQLVALDGYQGKYIDADNQITLNGMGKITDASGNIGVYTVSDETKEGYDVVLYAIFEETSNKVFINLEERTYEMEINLVTVTYVNDGAPVEPQSVYVGVKTELSKPEAKADMVFRGWYVQDDETQTLVSMTEFVATNDVTLVAKWDVKVTLTIVYGNGLKNATHAFGVGDALNMSKYQPEFTDGKVFSKWYTTADEGVTKVDFTATTITEDTTVYCEWVEAVQWYGTYVGKNVYGNDDNTLRQRSLTISATGVVSGEIKGTINADGTAVVDGSSSRFMAYDGNVVIAPYSNKSEIGTDFYLFAKGDAGTQVRQYKHLGAANKVVVSYVKNGETIYALVWGNKVYDNVTWTSTDGDIAAKDLYNHVSSLTFYSRAGEAIVLD